MNSPVESMSAFSEICEQTAVEHVQDKEDISELHWVSKEKAWTVSAGRFVGLQTSQKREKDKF